MVGGNVLEVDGDRLGKGLDHLQEVLGRDDHRARYLNLGRDGADVCQLLVGGCHREGVGRLQEKVCEDRLRRCLGGNLGSSMHQRK